MTAVQQEIDQAIRLRVTMREMGHPRRLERVIGQLEAVQVVWDYADAAYGLGVDTRHPDFRLTSERSAGTAADVLSVSLSSPLVIYLGTGAGGAAVSGALYAVAMGLTRMMNKVNEARSRHAQTNTEVLRQHVEQADLRHDLQRRELRNDLTQLLNEDLLSRVIADRNEDIFASGANRGEYRDAQPADMVRDVVARVADAFEEIESIEIAEPDKA
jgi:hypothetical protein